jgi:glyoxylase-like metal-dependent hydrolase (beta-lactamase superfamily II)
MLEIAIFTFNPFAENTYILYDETNEAVIVDPGCYESYERKTLKDFIERKSLKVVKLLNTHCHLDHVFGNEFVKKTFGVQCYAHQAEEFNIDFLEISAQMFGIRHIEKTQIDAYLEEGDSVEFGNTTLQVIFTPGHSPGHIVLYHEPSKICINGDVLFRGSIGRTDLPGGNHQTLLKSIREKMFSLPNDTIIYTGHGSPTTIDYEKKHNIFLIS